MIYILGTLNQGKKQRINFRRILSDYDILLKKSYSEGFSGGTRPFQETQVSKHFPRFFFKSASFDAVRNLVLTPRKRSAKETEKNPKPKSIQTLGYGRNTCNFHGLPLKASTVWCGFTGCISVILHKNVFAVSEKINLPRDHKVTGCHQVLLKTLLN